MPLPSACTASPLICGKRVAGEKLIPVPTSDTSTPDMCSNLIGASNSTPLPFAPILLMFVILTISLCPPVPTVSMSPTIMLVLAATFILVVPATAGADRVVCVALADQGDCGQFVFAADVNANLL